MASTSALARIQGEFAEHGYEAVPAQPLRPARNTSSMRLTHLACGTTRASHVNLQRARSRQFRLCTTCDGVVARQAERNRAQVVEILQARLGAVLVAPADPDAVFVKRARDGDSGRFDTLRVRCNKCLTERLLSMAGLLKKTGNGCGTCTGNRAHDPAVVIARAAEYGLEVLNPDSYAGGSSVLRFRCVSCDHRFARRWQDQRKRACGQCASSSRFFGEMLLATLCRHYFPDQDWIPQYGVKGLVPDEPDVTLRYDLASPSLKLVIENHSEYHTASTFSFNGVDVTHTLERRRKFDAIKKHACGEGGQLADWHHAEVRFELKEINAHARNGSYLPAVTALFRATLAECGVAVDGQDPTAAELLAGFSRYVAFPSLAKDAGFVWDRQRLWEGRSASYALLHECGHVTSRLPAEFETAWRAGGSGCDWCDCSGTLGQWRQFIDVMAQRDWEVLEPRDVRQEGDTVQFACRRHPAAGVQSATRSAIRATFHEGTALLPHCSGCREAASAERRSQHAQRKVQQILVPFDALLRAHGCRLVEWTWKGTSHADGTFSKYRVECLACLHQRDILPHQARQALSRRIGKGPFCPACRPRAGRDTR